MAALTVAELTAVLKLRDEATAKAREIERNVSSSMERLGSSLTSIGTRLSAAITLPMVGLSAGTAKVASDYERQITKLVTLSGLTEAQMKAVRTSIESIGPASGKGPKELADAMLVVTSTGLRGAESIEVLRKAAELSAVGLGETAGVARALTSSITAYGKETVSAARASDVLIATVREGGAEATEMAGAFGRVVGIAQQAGVSIEEVGAQVATFTRLGISADEAVTALRGTILGLLAPTDETKEALAELGTTADQVRASIRERGLADTLIDLVTASKGNVEVLSHLIPNVRALAGVLGTAGSQAEAYKETLDKIQTSSQGVGDTQRALERASKDSGFQFDQLVAKVQALAVQMGEKLLPHLIELEPLFTGAVGYIADLVEAFADLPDWVQTSALVLAGLAAAAGPIALVTGQIVGLIAQIKILQSLSLGASLTSASASAAGVAGSGLLGKGLAVAGAVATSPVFIVGMAAAVAGALISGRVNAALLGGDAHPAITGIAPTGSTGATGPNAFTQAIIRAGQGGTGPLSLPAGALAGIFGPATASQKPAGAGLFGGAKPISEDEIKRLAKGAEDFQRSIEKANEDAFEFFRTFQQSGHLNWIRDVRSEWERSSDAITRATNSETARILAGLPLAPIGKPGISGIDLSTPGARKSEAQRVLESAGFVFDEQGHLKEGTSAQDVRTASEKIVDGLEPLSRALSELAQVSGGLSGVVKTLAQIVSIANIAGQSGRQIAQGIKGEGVAGALDVVQGGIGGVASLLAATGSESRLQNAAGGALSGATTGAAIGTAFAPGIGTAIGAAIGGAAGFITGIFRNAEAKANDLRDQIIANAGGLDALNRSAVAAGVSLDRLLAAKNTKQVEAAMAAIQKAIDATLERVAKLTDELAGVSSRGELVSPDLLGRLLKDKDQPGVQQALGTFRAQQGAALLGSVGQFLDARKPLQDLRKQLADIDKESASIRFGDTPFDQLSKSQLARLEELDKAWDQTKRTIQATEKALGTSGGFANISNLRKQLAEIDAESASIRATPFEKLSDEQKARLDELDAAWDQTKVRINAELKEIGRGGFAERGFAAALVAGFGELIEGGASTSEALDQIRPLVERLQGELTALGLDGGAAFNSLSELTRTYGDDVSRALLGTSDASGKALTSLQNLGLLSQETFVDLSHTIADAFYQLELQGKGGENALRVLQKPLQRIWELQQDFGYEVDESTQKVLDFAAESGLIGDKFRPAQDQLLQAFQSFATKLEEILNKLVHGVPDAASEGADRAQEVFDRNPLVLTYSLEQDGAATPTLPDVEGFAHGSGGVRNFGRGTLAVLHGREAVVTEAQLASLRGGARSSRATVVHAHVNLDRRQIAEALIDIGSDGI